MRHIKDYGGEGQVIILLHGFLATSKYWLRLSPYLSKAGYRVITIDLLGFGKAPKPTNAEYTYSDHVHHLQKSIDSLQLNDRFVLAGHSMGALLTLRYCTEHPKRVASAVLLHPPLYKDLLEARETLRQTGKLYRFLLDSRFRRLGWMIIKIFLARHIGCHGYTAREKSLINVIEKAEALNDLQFTQTSTLLVVGSQDRPEYIRNLPGSKLSDTVHLVVADVDHHSPVRNPEFIFQKIVAFINK